MTPPVALEVRNSDFTNARSVYNFTWALPERYSKKE